MASDHPIHTDVRIKPGAIPGFGGGWGPGGRGQCGKEWPLRCGSFRGLCGGATLINSTDTGVPGS